MRGRAITGLGTWSIAVGLAIALATIAIAPVAACSPAQDPTIQALGPDQVVLVGRTGEPVAGGRAFHVERWYNGSGPAIVTIAFKEGAPIGDCSYVVRAGWHLVIAPLRSADGAFEADLGTLQSDVDSDAGRRYVAEAERLFGAGTVPEDTDGSEAPGTGSSGPPLLVLLVVAVVVAAGLASVRRRRRDPAAILEAASLVAERDPQHSDAIAAPDRYDITPRH